MNKKYLVTTSLQELWPKNEDIWLLNQGCAPDPFDTEIYKKWNIKGIIPDPFSDGQQNKKHYDEIWNITLEIIDLLSIRLNQIHNCNHDSKFWGIHIGFWVLNYVTVIYDRYTQLQNAKTFLKELTVTYSDKNEWAIPKNTVDFVMQARFDNLNSNIYSFISKEIGVKIEKVYLNEEIKLIVEQIPTWKESLIKKVLKKTIGFFSDVVHYSFFNQMEIGIELGYFPKWFNWLLLVTSLGKYYTIERKSKSISDLPVNEHNRNILSEVPEGQNEINSIIIKLIGNLIPKSLVEEFSLISEVSAEAYKDYSPKIIYSANLWYYDELFFHWVTKTRQEKVILIGGEHGGAPFIERYLLCFKMETLKTDYYFTWGWNEYGNNKIIPTNGTKLIRFQNKKNPPKGNSILYTSTAEPRFGVASFENFANYLDWQRRFFESISKKLISNFIVRPHYNDFGWKIKERIKKVVPEIQFDSWNITFNQRLNMSNSRLYVFDYLSTTFAEAMAYNLPSILYMDRTIYPVSQKFSLHFELLKSVNILHDSPESAALWIEKVYENPNDWFYNQTTQEIVTEFCRHYARTSETPLRDWKRIFDEILDFK